jgi:hypothetical protein
MQKKWKRQALLWPVLLNNQNQSQKASRQLRSCQPSLLAVSREGVEVATHGKGSASRNN